MIVTRADVAKYAGVSPATVSYVINNSRGVSPELTEKVLAAIKELNYTPNQIARSMVTKQSNTICAIVNDLADPLQAEVIKEIEMAANNKGYSLFVCNGIEGISNYIKDIISRRVDGVYISAISTRIGDDDIRSLISSGIKVVTTDVVSSDVQNTSKIINDFENSFDLIVEHLHGLNHKKIVYISAFDDGYKYDNRLNCFKNSMKTIVGDDNPLIIHGSAPYDTTPEKGFLLTEKLINSNVKFTAIIATNDIMAFGCIKALLKHGLRVPEDVSVVGTGNIAFCDIFNPSLTSIGFDKAEYGKMVFNILYEAINGNGNSVKYTVPFLENRSSTAVANQNLL